MPDDNSSAPAPVSAPVANPPAATSAPAASGAQETPNIVEVPSAPVSDAVVKPEVPTNPAAAAAPAVNNETEKDDTDIVTEVAKRIGEAHNVLVALSANPSVDEMAAAIGLSLYLDRLGKRATAIYSGQTPNALEFLKPEETFEDSVDTLQDFVIALNKEKADHLRYKLDGDYVKIYITPYKSKISEEDLEFSYGDFNVDLVLALGVANGVDLDAALREHGRIMHDATIINITTGDPGKLGEIEWSDKTASSVSEMIAKLLYSVSGKVEIEKEEATAFLTGIVAATNRFSNEDTTPEAMRLASKLMESGADQQLVSKNITPDVENELFGAAGVNMNADNVKDEADPTKLSIQHDDEKETGDSGEEKAKEEKVEEAKIEEPVMAETEEPAVAEEKVEEPAVAEAEEPKEEKIEEPKEEGEGNAVVAKEPGFLDDLKEAEANLAGAGKETTPEVTEQPLEIDSAKEESLPEVANELKEESEMGGSAMAGVSAEQQGNDFVSDKPEKVIQPPTETMENMVGENEPDKYGQMLEDALAGAGGSVAPTEPVVSTDSEPIIEPTATEPVTTESEANPATAGAPEVATNPEINGVPEINYMPMPGEEVLPPPPAPPIDMETPVSVETTPASTGVMPTVVDNVETPIEPAMPKVEETPEPLGAQPAMQDQVYAPQANDPGAFKIPGM